MEHPNAIETYGREKAPRPKPPVTVSETIDIPVPIQERYIVRIAVGMHEDPRYVQQAAIQNHPDYFTSYEEAKAWGVANCPVGYAFGITKLYAKLTHDEVMEAEAQAAKAAE